MTRRRRIDETCVWCKAAPGKACVIPQWPPYEARNPHLVGDPDDEDEAPASRSPSTRSGRKLT